MAVALSYDFIRNSSDVRKSFKEFFDNVVYRNKMNVVNRHGDYLFGLSQNHLKVVVQNVSLEVKVEEVDDGYLCFLNELEHTYGNGETVAEALSELVSAIDDYIELYFDKDQLFFQNRPQELVYLLKYIVLKLEGEDLFEIQGLGELSES